MHASGQWNFKRSSMSLQHKLMERLKLKNDQSKNTVAFEEFPRKQYGLVTQVHKMPKSEIFWK
jgi:hypothetical protein